MGSVNPTTKKSSGLHHLVPRIMNGSSGMVNTSDERELICDLRMSWQYLRQGHLRRSRLDRLKRTTNLRGRIRFRVKRVNLTRSTQIEDQDDISVVVFILNGTSFLCLH